MRVLVWLIVMSALAGACSGGDGNAPDSVSPPTSQGSATSSSAPPPAESNGDGTPSFDRLLRSYADADGVVTPELALSAFSMQFGEVEGSLGFPRDGSQPESGTAAMQWIIATWDQLTDGQQTAVIAAVDAYSGLQSGSAAAGDAEPTVVAAVASPPAFKRLRAEGSDGEQAEWDAMAEEAERTIRDKLGGVDLEYDLILVDSVTDGDAETGPTTTLLFDLPRFSNDSCRIAIGGARFFDEDSKKTSAITHEMFHCWSLMNSINIAAWSLTPQWYQEGIAAWVGETIAGGSSYSATWWPRYLLPTQEERVYPLYTESYSAIGFWTSVDAASGGRLWSSIATLNTLAGSGDNAVVMSTVLGLVGDAGLASIPGLAALRTDWGANWTLSGPGITPTARIPKEIDIAAGAPDGVSVSPGWQQLELFNLDVGDSSEPALVEVTGSGWMAARWNTAEEFTIIESGTRSFCIGECTCPDGSSLAEDATLLPGGAQTLAVGLIGGPATGSAVSVSMSTIEGDCPNLDDGGSPFNASAFVGVWQAEGESVIDMFNNAFAYESPDGVPPLTVVGVNGEIIMTLDENGEGTISYNDLKLILDETAPFPSLRLNGLGEFEWRLQAFEIVFGGDPNFNITATADVLGETVEFPINNTEISTSGGESRFVFTMRESRLILSFIDASVGRVFFPHIWIRVG